MPLGSAFGFLNRQEIEALQVQLESCCFYLLEVFKYKIVEVETLFVCERQSLTNREHDQIYVNVKILEIVVSN